MNIICKKTICKFNNNGVCRINNLQIGKNAICLSFVKKNKDDINKSINKSPKYNPFKNIKDLNINCNSKCLFNENGKCKANGITVNCLKEKPFCITFLQSAVPEKNNTRI